MARVNCAGLTELGMGLNLMAGRAREATMRMLEYAGKEIAKATSIEAQLDGLVRTGQMAASIKPGPVMVFSDSACVEVWPHGNRTPRGRNAEVGFIQHYGRGYGASRRRAGIPFFNTAAEEAERFVQYGMEDIWNATMGR